MTSNDQSGSAAVCEICGATFTPMGPRKFTCSPECAHKRRLIKGAAHRRPKKGDREHVQSTCVICGATFTPFRNQKYTCSPACAQERERIRSAAHRRDRRRLENKQATCEICGASFYPSGNQKYTCSPECSRKRERMQDAANHRLHHRPLEHVQATCVICGAPFETTVNSRTKTCSPECSRILKRKTRMAGNYVHRTCPKCGQEFTCSRNRRNPLCHECQRQETAARQEAAAAAKRHREIPMGVCVICGAEFQQNMCRSRKTCSIECSLALEKRTLYRCQRETRVCQVCGAEFLALKIGHVVVCRPCRKRLRAEALDRRIAAQAEEKQRRKRLRDAIAAEKKSKIRKSAATPQQPRPLTMAQRARMLRQAIAKSAFQQRARAELLAAQSSQNRPLFIPEPSGMKEFDAAQDW